MTTHTRRVGRTRAAPRTGEMLMSSSSIVSIRDKHVAA